MDKGPSYCVYIYFVHKRKTLYQREPELFIDFREKNCQLKENYYFISYYLLILFTYINYFNKYIMKNILDKLLCNIHMHTCIFLIMLIRI